LSPTRLTPRLTLGSSQAIVSAVEARAGIAFVSSLAVEQQLKSGSVKKVRLAEVRLKRDFHCIYYTERLATRLVQEFVSFIRETAEMH
jgi:DNA-binding transcriptional LysR family regulator